MKRWQLYFKFDHLPPHLRAISEPFAKAARSIVEWDRDDTVLDPVVDDLNSCRRVAERGARDDRQVMWSVLALGEADRRWFNEPRIALEWLLFAKDCAVRAHLPDPT